MIKLSVMPLPLLGVALAASLLLVQEIGYRCGRRLKARDEITDAGHLLSAALALLGLLIAFTFSMAADRYEARRTLVVQEANALSTTYLRVQALDEPFRSRLSQAVVAYGQSRQNFFAAGEDSRKLAAAGAETDILQSRLWADLVAAIRATPAATINPALLETTNELFDLASSRQAALDARVPDAILRSLVIYALVAAAILGYGLASGGRRHGVASLALFILVSLAVTLILDLDRPRAGGVTISQSPLTRTLGDLKALEVERLRAVAPR
jgi:hypothetical protein